MHTYLQATCVVERGLELGHELATKQVYQAKPEAVTYIVPVTSILGRLALSPVGEHGTIPATLRGNASFYPRGQCDQQGRPGTGSKLFYINTWAMTWPCDHPLPKRDQY